MGRRSPLLVGAVAIAAPGGSPPPCPRPLWGAPLRVSALLKPLKPQMKAHPRASPLQAFLPRALHRVPGPVPLMHRAPSALMRTSKQSCRLQMVQFHTRQFIYFLHNWVFFFACFPPLGTWRTGGLVRPRAAPGIWRSGIYNGVYPGVLQRHGRLDALVGHGVEHRHQEGRERGGLLLREGVLVDEDIL